MNANVTSIEIPVNVNAMTVASRAGYVLGVEKTVVLVLGMIEGTDAGYLSDIVDGLAAIEGAAALYALSIPSLEDECYSTLDQAIAAQNTQCSDDLLGSYSDIASDDCFDIMRRF